MQQSTLSCSPPLQALVCSREPLSLLHLQALGLHKGLPLLPGWGTLFFLVDTKVRAKGSGRAEGSIALHTIDEHSIAPRPLPGASSPRYPH